MRAVLRSLIATTFLVTIVCVSLIGLHHDDWHDHVETLKKQMPATNGMIPPALTKYIPPAFQPKPEPQPLEYGSLPWLGKVELDPMPYPTESEKAIVMAKLSNEDTDWVQQELPDWKAFIYTVDDQSAPLHTAKNKGREALAYLTFINEYYAKLPRTIAFVHSHQGGYPQAWHADNQDFSNVESLQALRIPYVQGEGYVNLRCNTMPGCPAQFKLGDGGSITEEVMKQAWTEIFGDTEPMPHAIGAACCSQFAVSKDQIRERSEDDYKRMLKWLLKTKLDDHQAGRIMEYIWHIIFKRPTVFCPPVEDCYCNVYGACDWNPQPQ
ncbi:MAG: hypothetical protein Q9162_001993 [Coniocarpon cinnabarinum]